MDISGGNMQSTGTLGVRICNRVTAPFATQNPL